MGIGWFFDLEMSTSTSLSASWVGIDLDYKYMEIGREKNGILSMDITNKTEEFLKLEKIVSNVSIFLSPSSPIEYPIEIPPKSKISLTSFTIPVDMKIEFSFNKGKIDVKFPVGSAYKKKRNDIVDSHFVMFTNFLAAVLMFLSIREMVKR